MRSVGLDINKDSFGKSPSKVKINYVTKLNDSMFDVTRYLMHHLYYMPTKDDSVKFFTLDLFERKYKIVDLKNKDTALGTFATILSMFKTNAEALTQQEPTNLGAFLEPVGKTTVYETLFDTSIYGYSYEKNTFT